MQKDEVVKMEEDMLKSLKFELGNPIVRTFLRKFTRVAKEDYKASSSQLDVRGYYLVELSASDYGCVRFLTYVVTASVIFLPRFITRPKRHSWSSAMQQYSGYKVST